jgi:hypothetical protein
MGLLVPILAVTCLLLLGALQDCLPQNVHVKAVLEVDVAIDTGGAA